MRSAANVILAVLALAGCEAGTASGGLGTGRGPGPGPGPFGRDGVDGGPRMTGPEQCGNGADDDGDGAVDEDCGCTEGATQGCWPGDPADRGRGECADGTQTCVRNGEFLEWGPCEGAMLPPAGGSCCASAEFGLACLDGKDNDCDSILDCGDGDCASGMECGGMDVPDDGGDGVCVSAELSCGDGRDEDCDGRTDCADSECAGSTSCGGECECVPGVVRWCDTPEACAWGRQTCTPDGSWGACIETDARPGDCAEEIFGWLDPTYNTECCISTGECCQNYPSDESVGCPAPTCR